MKLLYDNDHLPGPLGSPPSLGAIACNSSYQSDVRDEDHRPTPRVKTQDRVDEVESTPPDSRPESMRPSTRVIPHERQSDAGGETAARKT